MSYFTHHEEVEAMYVEFTDDLLTGNEMIDEQHKELIGRIHKFQEVLDSDKTGEGQLTAISTLDFLSDYVNYHFDAEEVLQWEIEYPGLDGHLKQHAEFKKTIAELQEWLKEEDTPSEEFVCKVQEKVVDWFLHHIQTADRSVAEYKNMRLDPENI